MVGTVLATGGLDLRDPAFPRLGDRSAAGPPRPRDGRGHRRRVVVDSRAAPSRERPRSRMASSTPWSLAGMRRRAMPPASPLTASAPSRAAAPREPASVCRIRHRRREVDLSTDGRDEPGPPSARPTPRASSVNDHGRCGQPTSPPALRPRRPATAGWRPACTRFGLAAGRWLWRDEPTLNVEVRPGAIAVSKTIEF